MNKCKVCKKETNRPMYCSPKCCKIMWYKIRHPQSYYNNNSEFWKTDTGIGLKWERYAAKLLKAEHRIFTREPELLLNGKTIDVKIAKLNKRKNKRGMPVKSEQKGYWCFHLENKNRPDFFFCIALLNNKPLKKFLIPVKDISDKKWLAVGWKSKYDKYLFSPHCL